MSKSKPIHEFDVATLEMFVLDVLRHDEIEQLPNIVRMLNDEGCIGWRDHWSHDFNEDEVQTAVQELLDQGKLEALHENEQGNMVPIERNEIDITPDGNSVWYRPTPAGHAAWDQWKPPT